MSATELYHVSDDIGFVVFGLDGIPAQRHIIALLNPRQVAGGLSWSWGGESATLNLIMCRNRSGLRFTLLGHLLYRFYEHI